jgi:hypothetical protein
MEVNETNCPLTETPMEQPIEAPVPTVEDTEKETSAPKQTLEEVVQRLKEINEKNDLTDKQEIDSLKQTFYKLQKAKSEAARKAFIDEGGKAEDFTPETERRGMWLRRACRGGEKNTLTFERKRKDVLIKTQVRLK